MNGFYVAIVLLLKIVDPPPLQAAELYTWMSRVHARACMTVNREYQQALHRHRLLFPDQCHAELEEACKLYRVWDAIDDCHSSDKETVQLALIKLKETLGEDAFWRGEVPPPVPLWRIPILP